MDNIKEWTSMAVPELLTRASCRSDWKRIPHVPPDNPISQRIELTEVNGRCSLMMRSVSYNPMRPVTLI